ncbi:hypothetical protein [Erwinia persicina]|uniref:hypothetical protein n=1 Tax=Erwinia persicina TaxID=55211 RepID=UPI001782A5F4|nr:hypothetical protein [Erwinia persicina]MBD8162200.1 hypothetical protein [Erwinia persicina]MBD8215150.1 hypothetical protein [Erwinia persicina]
MVNKAQLIELAERASEDLFAWASFVAHTEFLWQDSALVTDADAWQSLWFELEIVNGLALAEWEEQGRPADWSASWRENYQQDARELAAELLALTA